MIVIYLKCALCMVDFSVINNTIICSYSNNIFGIVQRRRFGIRLIILFRLIDSPLIHVDLTKKLQLYIAKFSIQTKNIHKIVSVVCENLMYGVHGVIYSFGISIFFEVLLNNIVILFKQSTTKPNYYQDRVSLALPQIYLVHSSIR